MTDEYLDGIMKKAEIKTPITDRYTFVTSGGTDAVLASVSKKLERDLALVTQERNELRKKLDEAYEHVRLLLNEFATRVLDGESEAVDKARDSLADFEELRALKTEA